MHVYIQKPPARARYKLCPFHIQKSHDAAGFFAFSPVQRAIDCSTRKGQFTFWRSLCQYSETSLDIEEKNHLLCQPCYRELTALSKCELEQIRNKEELKEKMKKAVNYFNRTLTSVLSDRRPNFCPLPARSPICDYISEIRGDTISTFELPRAIPLWQSKPNGVSSKIKLFPLAGG